MRTGVAPFRSGGGGGGTPPGGGGGGGAPGTAGGGGGTPGMAGGGGGGGADVCLVSSSSEAPLDGAGLMSLCAGAALVAFTLLLLLTSRRFPSS